MPLTPTQADFAKFLASLWLFNEDFAINPLQIEQTEPCVTHFGPTNFFHQYKITRHPAWNTWKAGIAGHPGALGPTYTNFRQNSWWCRSLKDACLHYSWSNGSAARVTQLSQSIKAAINIGNTTQVKDLCFEIFKWGNVAKKANDASRLWVENVALNGALIGDINRAVQLLQPTAVAPLMVFDGESLLMNSAMTKIYAAADFTQTVIMYDGRVGSALGLFVRLFLQSTGGASVPQDLAFLWGPAQGVGKAKLRNPSKGTYKFKSLYGASVNDADRANVLRLTNRILEETCVLLLQKHNCTATVHDLEKALFMIGYRVC